MAGFTSPNILFLNTYDSMDRKYMTEIVPKLKMAGYDSYAELYAGGFAMCVVVAESGIKAKNIRAYDISLYSNALGYVFSGKDLSELEVRKDGHLIGLAGEDQCMDAATIIYEQALARLQKSDLQYYKYLIRDLIDDRDRHVRSIAERIRKMDSVLHGMSFERKYIWDALKAEKNSEHTFVCSNPPTYKGAYEKFFDTDGRITWKGDALSYEIWDGSVHCKQFMEKAKKVKPLVFLLQQAYKGKAATPNPVFSRFLSLDQNVYYNSNRPEEIAEINGMKEQSLNGTELKKSKFRIMPFDYEIREDSKMRVFVEENKVAEYYRRMWLHRITGKSVSFHLCVLVDGYICGFIGISVGQIIMPYNSEGGNALILSYAVNAPNCVYRNARLLVGIAKSKRVITEALSMDKKSTQMNMYVTVADSICTVEYSRYHEVKGLRGLMKREKETKMNDNLFALKYSSPLNDDSTEKVLLEFLRKEKTYKQLNGK